MSEQVVDPQAPLSAQEEAKILKPSRIFWRTFLRDKAAVGGGVMVAFIVLVALLSPVISPQDPLKMVRQDTLLEPSFDNYVLGTDRFGRDQLSRLIYATRTSVIVSIGSVSIAVAGGMIIGIISGFYGGRLDGFIMRCLDVIYAFPVILLALVIIAIFGPNTMNLLLTIGFIYSTRIARVTRGSVMAVKQLEYIEAVRSVGARDISIMFFFIMPNVLSPVIVQATFFLSTAIQVEAGLSFLGLGTQPPTPSWGLMLNESRRFMEIGPWLTIFPGLAIMVAVLAFNLLGDGLRNALDPRLMRR
jgi:peptide/nickel transport system permease protein